MVEKKAVLHVHTNASDGTGTFQQVLEAALSAEIDILGINDHLTLDVRDRGLGGWHSSVFVMAGTELEDSHQNSHILAYGIDSVPQARSTARQLEFISDMGGLAIAAHPAELPGRLPKTRSYSWRSSSTEGLGGVEVWNYMSLWKRGISPLNIIGRMRHPDRVVEHPSPGGIDFWERVGGCAIAAPDAHALKVGIGRMSMELFPYSMLMRRLITHILLEEELPGDDEDAEAVIMESLRMGRCFTSNRLLGDAGGFRAVLGEEHLLLYLPEWGDVTVSDPGGILWQGLLEAGEHGLPVSSEGPVSIHVNRDGRTWIYCGIPACR